MEEEKKIPISINDLIPDDGITPSIVKEIGLYSEIYKNKLMEYEDRKQISTIPRKGFKLFLLSSMIAFVINKGITSLKTNKKDFMNLKFPYRLIVRGVAYYACMYTFFYLPVLKDIFIFRDNLNTKYLPRFLKYMKTQNCLVMNPNILNDPELTQEEYASHLNSIESFKMMSQAPSKKNI